ncbi:MAG: GntR family transcriptional regulator [Myxococcales bacterium]|nr:GntR family transcriptional regulator [Myxococcales bacterium]
MSQRFRFQVFPSSGLPLYRQLMDQVRAQIASHRLLPGEMLPSVRQTAGELEINLMTVSKAYSQLEREGVIEFVRGHGMRVKEPQTRGTLKERHAELKPLLEQAVAMAYQLSLSAHEVRVLLGPMLVQLDAARKPPRGQDK